MTIRMANRTIARIEESGRDLVLKRRDDGHYEIILNGVFLMATYGGAGEQTLMYTGLWLVREHTWEDFNVLVGGLGVGYSLIPAVEDEDVSRLEVAELDSAVIEWNYQHFPSYNNHVLSHPKVKVYHTDVLDLLPQRSNSYHLIILDTDNGPDWLVSPSNKALYQNKGLRQVRQALREGGVLGMWSATEHKSLEHALLEEFGEVLLKKKSMCDSKGRWHEDCLYYAKNSSSKTV